MKARDLPPQDYLRECFDYAPETGLLTWRERPQTHFPTMRSAATWNTRYANTVAGFIHSWGYRLVCINHPSLGKKRQFKAHRVIWKLVTGHDPVEFLDHINMDKADNRMCNLRETDKSGNSINRLLRPDNKSGATGVCWSEQAKKWLAYINVHGNRTYLGCFSDLGQAVHAREQAELRLHSDFTPQVSR